MSTLIYYRRMTRVFKVNGFAKFQTNRSLLLDKANRSADLVFTTVSRGIAVDRAENLSQDDVAHTLTRNAGEATQAFSVLSQVQHHWIIWPEIVVEEPLRSPPEAQRAVNCR